MGPFEQAREEIRSRADIVSVVGRHVPLKRRGSYHVGRCPFHDDRSPSLHVNPQLGIYKCFVCGAGGDVFKFLMEHEHMNFREAMEQLAHETGVQLPERTAPDPAAQALSQAARSALDWAMAWFHERLLETPKVLEYARSRGMSDSDIADFRIGFAPGGDTMLAAAPAAGHGREALVAAGLAVRTDSGHWRDRFRLRLVFPLLDLSKRPIGFAGRNLQSGKPDIPKYLNSPETEFYRKSHFLYGLSHSRQEAAKQGEVVVVEGYMDWMALWRHGLRNVVAASGTAFTKDQAKLLARQAKRVVCFFDGDKAGIQAAERSLPVLLTEGLEVRVANLEGTEAKDPDELLKSKGADALRERISGARHWVDFLLDGFWKNHPRPSPDQRADFLRRIHALLGAIPDAALREQCVQAAAPFLERLGIRESDLRETLKNGVPPPPAAPAGPAWRNQDVHTGQKKDILTGIRRAEAQFVHLVLSHPVLVLDARDHVHPSDLVEPRCRALWDMLCAQSEIDNAPPDPKSFAAGLDSSLAGFVAELFQLFEGKPDEMVGRKELDDFVRDLMARKLKEKRRKLAAAFRIAGESNPSKLDEMNQLLAQEAAIFSTRTDT
ncbi:MAG TPA: DNA primase [Fibrobacteria bacterium]|nr:DNA primase [Fibrobacteria bacterium]